ncbi:MAG: hypothetical protein ACP5UD_08120 [Conexivisphaera sp.]
MRWYGRQKRIEMLYDEAGRAWYASIDVQVGAETMRSGAKLPHIVRSERRSPLGGLIQGRPNRGIHTNCKKLGKGL